MDTMLLGQKVQAARRLRGLKQVDLARKAGLKGHNTVSEIERGKFQPATVVHEFSFLSRVFQVGLKMGAVTTNPVWEVEKPRVHGGRDRILSPGEEERLRMQLRPEEFAVVRFTVLTGFRRGEVFGLRPQDLDLEHGWVHLDATRTKSGKGRSVPLLDEAQELLKSHGELSRAWVWLPDWGRNRYNVGQKFLRRFQRACRRAGIEGLTFHGLRHTFASRLVMGGADLSAVQALLGHASYRETERYRHLQPSYLQAAILRLR